MRRVLEIFAAILLAILPLCARGEGTLNVTIDPSDARNQGAQWKLTFGPDTNYQNSGATVSNIPAGDYTLYFNTIPGWICPTSHNSTISITNGGNLRTDIYGFNVLPPTEILCYQDSYYPRMIIEWSAAPGATAYEVWRNTDSDTGTATCIANDVIATNYTDTLIPNDYLIYYWVKAKNCAGTTDFSPWIREVNRHLSLLLSCFGGNNTGVAVSVKESFESYTNNHLITAEAGWYCGHSQDLPYVTNVVSDYTGIFPLNATTHSNILYFETATGSTGISNIFTMSNYSNVYLDLMINPGCIEEPETCSLFQNIASTNFMFALFVDTNGHINILHQWMADGREECSNRWTTLSAPHIDITEWVRLTMAFNFQNTDGSGLNYFRLRINNGDWMTNAMAYTNIGNFIRGGPYFLCANQGLSNAPLHSLNGINLDGYSLIDDYVVCYENEFDGDSDNVPDWWETQYGIAPEIDASSDIDGDGMSIYQEFLADTDPTNKNSRLFITAFSNIAAGLRIDWQGGPSVTQYLERCVDLGTNPAAWTPIFTNIPPTSLATNFTDNATSPEKAYYRVRAVR